jgi:phosphoribosylglycinamide formyltransferase 1
MKTAQAMRVGVLGSGKGSNFVAIAQAAAAGQIPAEVSLVLSDVPEAGILEHARRLNVPARYLAPGKFRTKLDDDAEQEYVAALMEARVDVVVLAGFMRIIKGRFLHAFAGRIINIHPSLLPAFPGLDAWRQALNYGVKFTGCTVHFVDAGVDSGPIIAQSVVPVLTGDTPNSLHERIQVAERVLYPAVVGQLARGDVMAKSRTI